MRGSRASPLACCVLGADADARQDFGFLVNKEGGLLYFHRNSMLAGNFDELKRGDELFYVEEMGDTGPIASKVRVKANGYC